ncbi:MAG: hypothetical protein AAF228_11940 [Pseudomonadota bacterium]
MQYTIIETLLVICAAYIAGAFTGFILRSFVAVIFPKKKEAATKAVATAAAVAASSAVASSVASQASDPIKDEVRVESVTIDEGVTAQDETQEQSNASEKDAEALEDVVEQIETEVAEVEETEVENIEPTFDNTARESLPEISEQVTVETTAEQEVEDKAEELPSVAEPQEESEIEPEGEAQEQSAPLEDESLSQEFDQETETELKVEPEPKLEPEPDFEEQVDNTEETENLSQETQDTLGDNNISHLDAVSDNTAQEDTNIAEQSSDMIEHTLEGPEVSEEDYESVVESVHADNSLSQPEIIAPEVTPPQIGLPQDDQANVSDVQFVQEQDVEDMIVPTVVQPESNDNIPISDEIAAQPEIEEDTSQEPTLLSTANKGRVIDKMHDTPKELENLSEAEKAILNKPRPAHKQDVIVSGQRSDDLKRIKGVGIVQENKLQSLGIESYQQIANLTENDVKAINEVLGSSNQVQQENWIEQAKVLSGGQATEYAKSIDQSEKET